jgi:hypothetical protein
MKKKLKYPIIAIIGMFSFSLLISFVYFNYFPDDNGDTPNYGNYPMEYNQNLDIKNPYIYNITEFGNHSTWQAFPNNNDENKTIWNTNKGGQIKINFTGFYEPSEELNLFLNGGEVPYMDVNVSLKKSSFLSSNFSIQNISNIEASYNFFLGFNEFKSGFIVPFTNMTNLKEYAIQAKSSNPNCSGSLNIEETYNFIFIAFTQRNAEAPDSNLLSYMTYDKKTGLLVRAFAQCGDYKINISLINYSFDISERFEYNVLEFEQSLNITNWHSNLSYGIVKSNPNGKISVEFKNYHSKSINDTSVFNGPIPHLDISFIEKKSWENYELGVLIENGLIENISNTELANSMGLGFNHFDSGFYLPIDNLSRLEELAFEQNQSGGWEADIEVKKTNLTIQFIFNKQDSTKKINLIYDKLTGLLQYYSIESNDSPNIEFQINYYNPLVIKTNITLIVEHWNGDIDIWANFSLFVGEKSVFDALSKWCAVQYVEYGGMGYFITSIDGDDGDWLYSVNGVQPAAAASKVNINNNDKIKWWRI